MRCGRPRRRLAGAVVTLVVGLATAGSSMAAVAPTAGRPSSAIGDELYPELGSADLDVLRYDWRATYDAAHETISATSTIEAATNRVVDQIELDVMGPDVSEVSVDGEPAPFAVGDRKLTIELPGPARWTAWRPAEIVVTYTAFGMDPGAPTPPHLGWFSTADGTSYTLNEPDGARQWMPVNDHPSDKARWRFEITVAAGSTAVANGLPVEDFSVDDPLIGAAHTWVWEQDDPMSTYLLGVQTGPYEIVRGTGPHGLPLVSAVLRDDLADVQPFLDGMSDQIEFFEEYFGPYPLSSYGLAVTDSPPGMAMETQGRSTFSRDDLTADAPELAELLLSHELAHQWFGDAVSPAVWSDIWLNESFATYGQWMWFDEQGIVDTERAAELMLGQRQAPTHPTASPPNPWMIFAFEVYDGGATALHALRLELGDDVFFEVLSTWVADNDGTSRRTEDFIDLAERISGRQLDTFFKKWIDGDRQPRTYE